MNEIVAKAAARLLNKNPAKWLQGSKENYIKISKDLYKNRKPPHMLCLASVSIIKFVRPPVKKLRQ
jgi:hypothetical protein